MISKKIKEVKKRLKGFEDQIAGMGVSRDGKVLVLLRSGEYLQVIQSVAGPDVKVEVEDIRLLGDKEFFRWGVQGGVCSPPLYGVTCHHCASPQSNTDNTGAQGQLYDINLKPVGTTTVVKDFPFKGGSWFYTIATYLCRLGITWYCKYSSINQYDFAVVDYKPTADGTIAGVIFAGGAPRGMYAVAWDIANAPKEYRPDTYVSLDSMMDKEVFAYAMHCCDKSCCPIVKRRYLVAYKGFVQVYAYNNVYYFEPVYYLLPVDTPVEVDCCGTKISVDWGVQPGYSGSTVLAPTS